MATINPFSKFDPAVEALVTAVQTKTSFAAINTAYTTAKTDPNRKDPRVFSFKFNAADQAAGLTYEEVETASQFVTYILVTNGDSVTYQVQHGSKTIIFTVIEFGHENVRDREESLARVNEKLMTYIEFPPTGWNR